MTTSPEPARWHCCLRDETGRESVIVFERDTAMDAFAGAVDAWGGKWPDSAITQRGAAGRDIDGLIAYGICSAGRYAAIEIAPADAAGNPRAPTATRHAAA